MPSSQFVCRLNYPHARIFGRPGQEIGFQRPPDWLPETATPLGRLGKLASFRKIRIHSILAAGLARKTFLYTLFAVTCQVPALIRKFGFLLDFLAFIGIESAFYVSKNLAETTQIRPKIPRLAETLRQCDKTRLSDHQGHDFQPIT